MANKQNQTKQAEASKGAVQPEGTNDVNGIKEEIPSNKPATEENLAERNEILMGELQDRADELNGRAVKLTKKEKELASFDFILKEKEKGLEKWDAELLKRAKKLAENGKTTKGDVTYLKKLTNCWENGTLDEYLSTSAEKYEGDIKKDFFRAVKEAAELLLNP